MISVVPAIFDTLGVLGVVGGAALYLAAGRTKETIRAQGDLLELKQQRLEEYEARDRDHTVEMATERAARLASDAKAAALVGENATLRDVIGAREAIKALTLEVSAVKATGAEILSILREPA